MEPEVLGVMIPIIAIIGTFIMVIYLRKYTHAERIMMIDKGVSADLFSDKGNYSISFSLRASLLLIGIGLGILFGYFLDYHFNMEEAGYFAMIFIFGGIGLGLAYIVEERKHKAGIYN